MSTPAKPFITPEQYLEIERDAEIKSEYYNGEMFAMSGGSRWHSTISINVATLLNSSVRQGCRAFNADMRVRVSATGLYTYPDLRVACGPIFDPAVTDILLNPTLIVEVLSPSTEKYDRSAKFDHYSRIESLREYLLRLAGLAARSALYPSAGRKLAPRRNDLTRGEHHFVRARRPASDGRNLSERRIPRDTAPAAPLR